VLGKNRPSSAPAIFDVATICDGQIAAVSLVNSARFGCRVSSLGLRVRLLDARKDCPLKVTKGMSYAGRVIAYPGELCGGMVIKTRWGSLSCTGSRLVRRSKPARS